MKYLFGDSTPSPLDHNFIELLRDALDFSVNVALADEHVAGLRARGERESRAGDEEIRRLRAMEAAIVHCIEGTPKGMTSSATALGANAILDSTSDTIRAQESSVHRGVASVLEALEADEAVAREGCLGALATLLLAHDLPASATTLRLVLQPNGGYAATLDAVTPYGLASRLQLEIPGPHVFAHVVRLEKIAAHLEVQAPEASGWIRKEVKLKPQRLDRYFITSLVIDAEATRLSLRVDSDGRGAGFDVTVRRDEPRVSFARTSENESADAAGPASDGPFEISAEDAAKLIALHEALTQVTADLPRCRKALANATLDTIPFREHRRLAILVDRLVAAMSKTTEEISRRSLTPTELVLKRLVSGDRREEIFVSKSALFEKLAPLSESARERFLPLIAAIEIVPPPIPSGLQLQPPPSSRPTARMGTAPPPLPPVSPPPMRVSAPAPAPVDAHVLEAVAAPPPSQPLRKERPASSGDFLSIDILTTEPVHLHDEPSVIIDETATT